MNYFARTFGNSLPTFLETFSRAKRGVNVFRMFFSPSFTGTDVSTDRSPFSAERNTP